jgi:hypothetical protein
LTPQIQPTARWPSGKRHWVLPKAFFLLSGPELGPKTWDLCAAAREGKSSSNACATSHAVPLRYFAAVLSPRLFELCS